MNDVERKFTEYLFSGMPDCDHSLDCFISEVFVFHSVFYNSVRVEINW